MRAFGEAAVTWPLEPIISAPVVSGSGLVGEKGFSESRALVSGKGIKALRASSLHISEGHGQCEHPAIF